MLSHSPHVILLTGSDKVVDDRGVRGEEGTDVDGVLIGGPVLGGGAADRAAVIVGRGRRGAKGQVDGCKVRVCIRITVRI